MSQGLKLRAEDAEDLRIISAVLQDSLIPLAEMQFLSDEGRFVMIANRFRWENCPDLDLDDPEEEEEWEGPSNGKNGRPANGKAKLTQAAAPGLDPELDMAFAGGPCRNYERVHSGICFDGVAAVRRRGFDHRDQSRIFELLAIERSSQAVVLVFAGGAAIRLEGEQITCRLKDLGEPWPTSWRPRHPLGSMA